MFWVTFWFLFGFAFMAGMNAHNIITSPLVSAPRAAKLDTSSVCIAANEIRPVPDCLAYPWTRSVTFRVDTGVSEADRMCAAVASKTRGFAGLGWKVSIYGPYSTEPISTCELTR
jgi:hypothetical protein